MWNGQDASTGHPGQRRAARRATRVDLARRAAEDPPVPRDGFGREIDYLRISLTDHCNLRCVYCMPLAGNHYAPSPDLLTAAEIEAVARAAVRVGFRKLRLTGGEPTLRADLIEIVERLAGVPGLRDLAMTTNGVRLGGLASRLAAAGLRRINVHLDSLDADRLARVMRWGTLAEIWAGIEAAEAAGLRPIKLNAVVVRRFNEDDVVPLAALTLARDWHVRFIETMPLGRGEVAAVARAGLVPSAETRARIEAVLGPLRPLPAHDAADESRNYRLPDARGVIGFISPVSEPYCGTCNRMRLTAEGRFHLCLLRDDELDVRGALRAGAGLDAIALLLLRAVGSKPTGHRLDLGRSTEAREMYQIGG
ncbi:MAG: GTP 3',8-cyclase MoaA [Deltaproteobacteria bacterium]|nr:MAG: GTP 3',8-cyclase MoaA [Deltaproteobacteria bacterium]TMA69652.1 MAG: GTP 3',8-cyclase MoaA [Deltaproteobacteria bacterium]